MITIITRIQVLNDALPRRVTGRALRALPPTLEKYLFKEFTTILDTINAYKCISYVR